MSRSLAAVLIAVAVLVPLGLALAWWRQQRGRHTSAQVGISLAVVGAVLLGQLSIVGASAVLLNRSLGLYPTWQDVHDFLNAPDPGDIIPKNEPVAITPVQAYQIEKYGWAPFKIQPPKGDGQYRLYTVPGQDKKTKLPVIVWVPPGYEKDSTFKGLKVVYLYNGAYGAVDWFVGAMRPGTSAAGMVREKKIPPFIIIAPEINVSMPEDTECTDYPDRGPQAYTWLARDVPAWAHAQLGIEGGAKNASAMGWSVGGYCAAKVHAMDPGVIGAAASVQGFFKVEADQTTGDLTRALRSSPQLRERTDVGWLLRNVPRGQDPVHLLVVTSRVDPQSYPGSNDFLRTYGGMPGIFSAVSDHEGHSPPAWAGLQPELWRFLVLRTDWPKSLSAP